ncbi:MAG: hypothetical protein HY731_11010 [Candidatus Tectomicrobia bacterium]|nr:hypothetical protein [Candidatus Tectomicrobia bacterium]
MNLEDKLSDLTANLVELEENSLFLERLFSDDSGRWIDVASLCSGLTDVEGRLEELRKSLKAPLQVTWLDSPKSVYRNGYCVILFFLEELHWSNVALYNKQWFLQHHGRE